MVGSGVKVIGTFRKNKGGEDFFSTKKRGDEDFFSGKLFPKSGLGTR